MVGRSRGAAPWGNPIEPKGICSSGGGVISGDVSSMLGIFDDEAEWLRGRDKTDRSGRELILCDGEVGDGFLAMLFARRSVSKSVTARRIGAGFIGMRLILRCSGRGLSASGV